MAAHSEQDLSEKHLRYIQAGGWSDHMRPQRSPEWRSAHLNVEILAPRGAAPSFREGVHGLKWVLRSLTAISRADGRGLVGRGVCE